MKCIMKLETWELVQSGISQRPGQVAADEIEKSFREGTAYKIRRPMRYRRL